MFNIFLAAFLGTLAGITLDAVISIVTIKHLLKKAKECESETHVFNCTIIEDED